MSYFRLKQDPAYLYAPVIPDVIKQIHWRYTIPEHADKIAPMTIFQLAAKERHDFLDLLDRQLFLVSSPLQAIIKRYVPKLNFKIVVLVSMAQEEQQVYYLPIFTPVDCLAEQSVQTLDKKTVKHLVLKQSVIKHQPIFRVQHGFETIIIARLDVAESLLRRNPRGLKLHPVELV